MSKLTAIIDADMITTVTTEMFYNSKGKYKTRIGGVKTRACRLWENMRMRVTDRLDKSQTTYSNILMYTPWLDFQIFAEWVMEQPNWKTVGWELDKDILSGESKVYAPTTCAFIPKTLNNLLNDTTSRRNTTLHKGVSEAGSGGYDVGIIYDGIRVRKYTKDYEEAVKFYTDEKAKAAMHFRNKYGSTLDKRVLTRLEEFMAHIKPQQIAGETHD